MEIDFKNFNIHDYNLKELIHEDSLSKIYIAEEIRTGKLFAVQKFKSPDNATQCLREISSIEIQTNLNHPCITKIYGINIFSSDNPEKYEPTILTDYFPNSTLRSLLENGQQDPNFSATKKIIILLGISHAMKYLHYKGVIHRDLKPGIVFLDDKYYPHLDGFLLSKSFPHPLNNSMEFEMTTGIGTLHYMAPEMLNEEEFYGCSVDVYSFSILAFEVLSGERAVCNLRRSIELGERPIFNEKVTDTMQKLISRCWSEDMHERPSFDEIFEKLSTEYKSCIDCEVDENEIQNFIKILNESCIND